MPSLPPCHPDLRTMRLAAGVKAALALVFAGLAVGVFAASLLRQDPSSLVFALAPATLAAGMAVGSAVRVWRFVR